MPAATSTRTPPQDLLSVESKVSPNQGKASLHQKERAGASFDVEKLSVLLMGGATNQERKRQAVAFAEADPILSQMQRSAHYSTDRRDIIKTLLKRLHHIKHLEDQGAISLELSNILIFDIGFESGGLGLHAGVFVPTIKNMTSKEQYDAWVPHAMNLHWIGCYAQTELSHGSNVRGLQTTATFLPEADEFEIHTPFVGAVKWWPGGLGVLSTHCVLYARLLVGGTDYGIHNFLVQIRSLEDHSPLPGITIGDIGPKFGTNANDNGYLSFNRVRIPRFNMLAKFSQVTKDGTYIKPSSGGAGVYGSMTLVRGYIAAGAFDPLASAATIAIRYAATRRQEPGKEQTLERPVLDYSSVQFRLLPQVATAYALRFMGYLLLNEIDDLNARIKEDPKQANAAASAMHASTCALKSCCTYLTADGIEECRRACGGHGFSNFSGLPKLYTNFFQSFTPEGDNWLLTQQTCSIILRTLGSIDNGTASSMTPTSSYLLKYQELLQVRCKAVNSEDLLDDVEALVQALQHRAAWLWTELREATSSMPADVNSKEETLVQQFEAARGHGIAIVLSSFVQSISDQVEDIDSMLVLHRLAVLFALSQIQKDRGDFLASGWLSPSQARLLQPAITALCRKLRPDAVPLVDAFGKSDFELSSAIGSYDGFYEQRLLDAAAGDPLNEAWNSGGPGPAEYWQYLKPLMSFGRGASGGVYSRL